MKTTLEVKDKFKESDSLKIASFKQHIRKTSPHKHNNYFEIICLTHGSGFHTIDTKQYEIQPPIVFTVRKEQVHFWDITSAPQGFVIIIKKSFIDHCLDQEIKRLISELSAQNCLFLQDNYALDIYALLQKEFDLKASSNQLVIEALLKAFLAKLLESAVPNRTKNSNSSIFQKYIDLLSQKEQLSNKVSYFAQLLNTTPQNLNAICRKEINQSAAEVLSEYIINEAKRLLIYTDLNVGEIAAKLHFKDNSHFSKYFKRHTLKTPVEYRE